MISVEFVQTMARYNAWQNRAVAEAAAALGTAELRRDRGAFFGSILATLNHIFWADRMWMSRLAGWARELRPIQLRGDLVWVSGSSGKEVARPVATCVVHMFNHQTHHRGQVHAMLTSAGVRTADTDLVFMPDDA